MKDVRDALLVGRDTQGKLIKRPLSPHLQVYRPQITSVLSIMHRISGVALSLGSLMLVCWLVSAAMSEEAFAGVQAFLKSPVGLTMMFGWTAALFYHLFAGIRHLAWDAGFGFEKHQYVRSGYAIVAATAIFTVLSWIVGVASL